MITICLSAINCNFVDAKATTASSMKLENFKGSVTLKSGAGKNKALRKGMRLLNKDCVETATNSTANILLDSTKAALVEESSAVSVKQSGKDLELTLDKGAVFFDVSKKLSADETFNIKTSNMVCGIRGTIGEVRAEVNKKKKAINTYVYLLEGQVKINYNSTAKKEKTKTINVGQKLTITTNTKNKKSTIKVSNLTPADISKDVVNRLQNDDAVTSRVKKACPDIDWSQMIKDVTDDKQESVSKEDRENNVSSNNTPSDYSKDTDAHSDSQGYNEDGQTHYYDDITNDLPSEPSTPGMTGDHGNHRGEGEEDQTGDRGDDSSSIDPLDALRAALEAQGLLNTEGSSTET